MKGALMTVYVSPTGEFISNSGDVLPRNDQLMYTLDREWFAWAKFSRTDVEFQLRGAFRVPLITAEVRFVDEVRGVESVSPMKALFQVGHPREYMQFNPIASRITGEYVAGWARIELKRHSIPGDEEYKTLDDDTVIQWLRSYQEKIHPYLRVDPDWRFLLNQEWFVEQSQKNGVSEWNALKRLDVLCAMYNIYVLRWTPQANEWNQRWKVLEETPVSLVTEIMHKSEYLFQDKKAMKYDW
jgi:hypothetical protein